MLTPLKAESVQCAVISEQTTIRYSRARHVGEHPGALDRPTRSIQRGIEVDCVAEPLKFHPIIGLLQPARLLFPVGPP